MSLGTGTESHQVEKGLSDRGMDDQALKGNKRRSDVVVTAQPNYATGDN